MTPLHKSYHFISSFHLHTHSLWNIKIAAFVNIFPPLHEMGTNLMLNYAAWGERRKGEIKLDEKIADKVGECGKLDDRIVKFQERQSFVNALKVLPLRSASASSESKSAKL